jgi:uncharacterized protein YoxC
MTPVDWISAIAGALGALAFVLLVAVIAVPLIKLGKVLDEATTSVKAITDHTVPLLDETTATVATANTQLVKVDTMTTSAAEVSQNVSALTALVAATVGKPLIKVAAFSFAVRQALSELSERVKR